MEISPSPPKPQSQQLLEAVRVGEYKRIKKLLANGVDIECTDAYGGTPLMVSAHQELPQTMSILLSAGASVAKSDVNGDTALHWAVHFFDGGPNCECIQLLLEAGADLEARNHLGETPLMKCVAVADKRANPMDGISVVDHSATLALLIDSGADVAARDNKQRSIRDILVKNLTDFGLDHLRTSLAAVDRNLLKASTIYTPHSVQARRM